MRDPQFYDRGERAYVAAVAEESGLPVGVAPDFDALPERTRSAMPDAIVPIEEPGHG